MGFWSGFFTGYVVDRLLGGGSYSRTIRRSSRSWSWDEVDWGKVLKWTGYVIAVALIVDIGLVIILIAPFYLAGSYLTEPELWTEERWRIYVLQLACPPIGWYGIWKSQSMGKFEKTCIVIGWIILIMLIQHVR